MKVAQFLGYLSVFSQISLGAYANSSCKYVYDANKTTVQWTAFKTNKKVPVKGKFTSFTVDKAVSSEKLEMLFKDVSFSIDGTKIDTTNPARDNTISKNFFQKWSGGGKITGKIAQFKEESTSKGSFDLVLTLNGVTSSIPMNYIIDEKGAFSAHGLFNIFDFNGLEAFQSLSKACKALHAPGGTWADMEVDLMTEFKKEC